jgi:hypothetical protein
MFSNDFYPKKTPEYICEKCDFVSCNKKDYIRHTQTKKHESNVSQGFSMEKTPKNPKKPQNLYVCDCGKKYQDNSGLWRHKKKCKIETEENVTLEITPIDEVQELKEFMKYLMKENSDMKSMMMKVIENGTHNTINTTNSHNKAFNLNLFLNETCKDAMNINDFVESIKLQVSDLENVGEIGFVEGISNIIVKNLNALDVTKRPIHCTDKKREIIYIKDENTWEKDESQCKMRRMIKKVVSKNQRLIPKFKEQNPEYNKSYSKVSDKYNKLIIESMGGSGDNDLEKENKIIRNIAKNIVVDKSL